MTRLPERKTIKELTCLRCGKNWFPRSRRYPRVCPNPACHSTRWDEPRKPEESAKQT